MVISRNWTNTALKISIGLLISLLFITGCSIKHKQASKEARFEPTTYDKFHGWDKDCHLEAFYTFLNSCSAINKKKPHQSIGIATHLGGEAKQWQAICKEAHKSHIITDIAAKLFFEEWFKPYRVTDGANKDTGTMTGYYEIELHGSKKRSKIHKHPIYSTPSNIKALKGKKTFTHAAINRGILQGKKLELAWVDSRSRLFFLHIQGSGVIKLAEGGEMKVGMKNQNGFKYTSIWPILHDYVKANGMKSVKIGSATEMMAWLDRHPKAGQKIMEQNQSYIFFEDKKGKGPIGAQGITVTPERSIAIDSGIYPYGMPIWVETSLPQTGQYKAVQEYNRLFIAQDRGGAILGAIRGDIFFGRGQKAEDRAGHMNKPGKYFVLFPKTVTIPSRYSK